jgi:peptidyl-prolyl cis-trans isomerase C
MIAFRRAVLLGLSGCILAACNAETPAVDQNEAQIKINRTADPVVARVNDTPIYQSDVQRAAEAQGLIGPKTALMMDDPIFRVTIDELIDQRLLSLDAVRTGAAQEPEAQRRLYAARDRILGNYRVETHIAETVNDVTIRNLYQAQRELAGRGEERRARQIVLADEATATEIAQRLDDEEDFDTLAAEFSIDEATRERGGELGWVSQDMLTGAIRTTVFNTPVGGRSVPFNTEDGWHIIEVQDTRTPSSRSFEESRDEIIRFMTFEAVEELLTDLRDGNDIVRTYEENAPAPTIDTDKE